MVRWSRRSSIYSVWSVLAIWFGGHTIASVGDVESEIVRKLDEAEFEATRSLATTLYETASDYLERSYRKESIFFLKRCLMIRPMNGPILALSRQLQDYDDPSWRKKKWRSPKAEVEQAFLNKQKSLDDRLISVSVKMGQSAFRYFDRAQRFQDRCLTHFHRALELDGGPYELDSTRQLVVGSATISAEATAYLIAHDLIRINGEWFLRDAMIRPLGAVDSIHESRGKYTLVRTLHSKELAQRIAAFADSGTEEYIRQTAQVPLAAIRILVLPDREAYQKYCDASDCGGFRQANGFFSPAIGAAVTFDQPDLETIVLHEGAHAFHDVVFGSDMPAWYDEGFANTFGAEGTWKRDGDRVRCGLPLDSKKLALLRGDGFLPLDRILHEEAANLWARNDEAIGRYYAESWALFTMLSTTTDPRFRKLFDEWESFSLGAGFGTQRSATKADDAVKLFDRIFSDVKADLEKALIAWIEEKSVRK